ncbi:hypothetical protein KL925_001906 [Ogataea polymorpha]|uniref:Transcription initiation factor IIF subunit alpha n=1 Tax=Ogataea polymorpha TaxID=460523 RepID=A0A9P8PUI9_9ASCO|nr:hypothetical protein KL937_001584 [Ogataea polymorpha]KAG7891108.1 hypothetical protein KL936_002392 [Ogataea polymorpha]KAG7894252.1 hypothetical protein KL908_002529 [Ogataea polymorpha]KAG7902205.1 hypothetical protein KL935_002165 [Ogataea polymorpha]KAG7911241.1 hypothetical protein KL906_001621 [Ogataea polymorpha]
MSNIKSEGSTRYEYFPLRACTEKDVEDTHYHILKFHSVKKVNPQKDFEEPARLHRKDPKNLQFQLSLKELEQRRIEERKNELLKEQKKRELLAQQGIKTEELPTVILDDDVDWSKLPEAERRWREEERQRREEEAAREAKRELEMSVVAPDGGARQSRRPFFKRKTRQVKVFDDNKRKLRYEEYYPWVLEDYDAKQAWIGNYEAGNTDNYCLLMLDNQNKCFKMIPVEKFYKFTPRNKYATLTLEEAEAKMKENSQTSRWIMRKMQDEVERGERVDFRYRKMRATSQRAEDVKRSDDETLDFDDEFQDDEEAPILEGNEEESKLVEKKIKSEQLRANNLIEKDEGDDLDDLFETRKIDKEGKKLRRALAKNAMNEVYDTDDEEDPYLSESEMEEVETQTSTDAKVKQEETGELPPISIRRTTPQIKVKSHRNGFVVLKASKEVLSEFPAGEWNPKTAIKRSMSPESGSQKKIRVKLEGDSGPITKADVDALVANGPIPLQTLVRQLKHKVSLDPNYKDELKRILRENFIVKDKMVMKRG